MTDEPTIEGWSAIPNWLLRDRTVSNNAKMVYLLISSRISRDGDAFPSQALLSHELGSSVETIKRAIKELRDRNLIIVWVERTDRGRRNHYRLAHDRAGGMGSPVTPPMVSPEAQ